MKEKNHLVLVDEKLQDYLTDFDIKNIKDLTLDQGNLLFIRVIEDFKNGSLGLDELSGLGSKIFHGIAKIKGEGSDLFFASLSAIDLAFEIRNVYSNIPQHMRDIDDFFKKYRGFEIRSK